jgi:hypothetical protein
MQSAVIRAFEASNFSTAIHELGHFFLEDLKRRALGSAPNAQEAKDWQTFKDWAASLGLEVNDNSSIPVAAHEYFARGFERFTWEGKAPSLGLRAVFTRMREFMLSLYRTATAFNSPDHSRDQGRDGPDARQSGRDRRPARRDEPRQQGQSSR